MTTPTQRVIARAQLYIGQHEDPMGSNRGAFVQKCQSFTWLRGTGWPWCVAFCQRVFTECNLKLPWGSAGAWDLYARAQKVGWTHRIPKVGDIAIWNFGTGHASIVRRVLGNSVETIDGNVGDKVSVCTRPISEARGFIRHPGLTAKKPVVVPPVKKPKKEVVGSAAGTTKTVTTSALWALFQSMPWIPANQGRKK